MINEFDDAFLPDDVADALMRQDRALALVERLRANEPLHGAPASIGGGRRDFRRWPIPYGVAVSLHDEISWRPVACLDLGVGGARVDSLPDWVQGPVPARLTTGDSGAFVVLADVMWRHDGNAGIRFEFTDDDERDAWSGLLIDALLATHSLR